MAHSEVEHPFCDGLCTRLIHMDVSCPLGAPPGYWLGALVLLDMSLFKRLLGPSYSMAAELQERVLQDTGRGSCQYLEA